MSGLYGLAASRPHTDFDSQHNTVHTADVRKSSICKSKGWIIGFKLLFTNELQSVGLV